MADALKHLHAKSIVHRDLKTANCFLSEDGSVKVGDLNVSKAMKNGLLQTQVLREKGQGGEQLARAIGLMQGAQ
jgi:serine/threonine protein kinase